ncbi:MAG: ABC transporter permease [Alphaproteobacteria bacterium]|nr:ABC transporter permease [Alphaproteobacteria bacterium]
MAASSGRTLYIQGRVISALIKREMRTRIGHLSWIWLLMEPILHCAVLVLLFEVLRRRSPVPGIDSAEFVLTGILPLLFYQRTSNQVLHATDGNHSLLVYPQVTPLDLGIARAALEIAILYVVCLGFLAVKWLLGFGLEFSDPPGIMLACLSLGLIGLGVGLAGASVSLYVHWVGRVLPYVNRLIYLTSGVFFTIENVSGQYREYLMWSPFAQAVEWARTSYFPIMSTDYLNLSVVFFALTGTLCAGVLAERATRQEARSGNY